MPHDSHFPILAQIGLNQSEASVYEILLENGPKTAQDLVEPSGLGRGNVYNVLTTLKEKGLVFEIEGKKTVFEAAPPSALSTLFDRERTRVKQLEQAFSGMLGLLDSAYALSTGKPIMRVFEGLEGFERALHDSLEKKQEILTYLDPGAIKGVFAEINKRYVTKRRTLGIPKRILLPNTPASHAYAASMSGTHTEIRIARGFTDGFKIAMEIYGGNISFLTLEEHRAISVVMEDPNIANMQRALFSFVWENAEPAS